MRVKIVYIVSSKIVKIKKILEGQGNYRGKILKIQSDCRPSEPW